MTLKAGEPATVTAQVSAEAFPQVPAFPFVADVEFSTGSVWGPIPEARVVFTQESLDAVDPSRMRTLKGIGWVPWKLQRHRVQDHISFFVHGQRELGPTTPGGLLWWLNDRWRERTTDSLITHVTYTHTKDSAGKDWDTTDLKMVVRVGLPYWQIVSQLDEQGLVEVRFHGNDLRVYNPGYGVDWTDDSGTVVRLSQDATSIPVEKSWDDVLTNVTIQGEEQVRAIEAVTVAGNTFGRLEGFIQQGGVTTEADARKYAKRTLEQARTSSRTVRITREASTMRSLPFDTYTVGDWVQVKAEGGWETERVSELTVMRDQNGQITITTGFGVSQEDLLARVARRQGQASLSGTPGGTGTAPVLVPLPPAAPTGVVVAPSAEWDERGNPRVRLSTSWTPVVVNIRGEATEVAAYDVWWRRSTEPVGASRSLAQTVAPPLVADGFDPEQAILVKVRARSSQGLWSEFSTEVSAVLPLPSGVLSAPTAPTVSQRGGHVTLAWDGLLVDGVPPRQFRRVIAETSTTETGTYVPVGQSIGEAGTLAVPDLGPGETGWYRFRAVDSLGNQSAPSAARSTAVAHPKAPASLVLTPEAEWDALGNPSSQVVVDWDAVTQNIDGTPVEVDLYEVWSRATDEPSLVAATTDGLTTVLGPLPIGTTRHVKVRARSVDGIFGPFTDEVTITTTAPTGVLAAPTPPTVSQKLGVVTVEWDGLLTDGAPPRQFRRVFVGMSATEDGAYSTVGTALGPDSRQTTIAGIPARATRWFRLMAVDASGIVSVPSAAVSITMSAWDDNAMAALEGEAAAAQAAADAAEQTAQQAIDDAETKAAAAQAAAEAHANAQAAAAEAAAIAAASDDAEAKANAAQAAAEAAAAADALAKANAAQAAAEAKAQTAQDAADAAQSTATAAQNAASAAAAAAATAQGEAQAAQAAADAAQAQLESLKGSAATLIFDGGFETGKGHHNSATRQFVTDPDFVRTGEYSYRVTRFGDTYPGASFPFTLEPETTYEFVGWFMVPTTVPSSQGFYVRHNANDEAGQRAWQQTTWTIPNDGVWHEKRWRFNSGDRPHQETTLWLQGNGTNAEGDWVYFDDIALFDVTAIVAAEQAAADAADAAAAAADAAAAAQITANNAATIAGNANTTANAAMSAVNSKVTIRRETTPPTGTGNPNDLWWQMSGSRVIGQWRWDDDEWVEEEIDGQVIANIDAARITTGYLDVQNRIQTGTLTADLLDAEQVWADEVFAGEARINILTVGAITANMLASDVGAELNLESNVAINLIVGQLGDLAADHEATDGSLRQMQQVYRFTPTGAEITSPDDAFALGLSNTGIEILDNGRRVSHWDAGQMHVTSFIGTRAELANHKIEPYGNGTVVRKL